MFSRSVSLVLVALALAFFVSQPALAADETHEGKVVKAANGKLTMTTEGKKHTHTIPRDAKITLDGKEATLEDLKEGYQIKVTTKANAVTKIEAKSKE